MFKFAILSVILAIAAAKPDGSYGAPPLGFFAARPAFAAGHAFAAAAPIAAPIATHVVTPGGYSHTYRTDVFHRPEFVAAPPAIAVAPQPAIAVAPIAHSAPIGFAHTSFGAPATFGHTFAGPTVGHGYPGGLSYARGFGTPFARYGF